MLYICAIRFDVTRNLEKFLVFGELNKIYIYYYILINLQLELGMKNERKPPRACRYVQAEPDFALVPRR